MLAWLATTIASPAVMDTRSAVMDARSHDHAGVTVSKFTRFRLRRANTNGVEAAELVCELEQERKQPGLTAAMKDTAPEDER